MKKFSNKFVRVLLCAIVIALAALFNEFFSVTSPVAFLTKVGAEKLPWASLLVLATSLLYTLFLKKIMKARGQSAQVMIVHFLLFAGILVLFSWHFLPVKSQAWAYYVLANVFYYSTTFLVWGALGRFFTLFEYQRLYPLFLLCHEGASIFADTLMYRSFASASTQTIARLMLGTTPVLLLVLVVLLGVKEENVVAPLKGELPRLEGVVSAQGNENSSKHRFSFSMLLVSLCCFEILAAAVYYRYSVVLEKTFLKPSDMSRFLSLFQIVLSLFTLGLSFVTTRFLFSRTRVFFSQFFMIGLAAFMLVLWIWSPFSLPAILIAFEFLKCAVDSAMLYPSRDLVFNSLPEKTEFSLRSTFEGIVVPAALIAVHTLLLLLGVRAYFDKILVSSLAVVLVIWGVSLFYFIRFYNRFHLQNIERGLQSVQVRSVQAVGEFGHRKAVPLLVRLVSGPDKSTQVSRTAILSLGRIGTQSALNFVTTTLLRQDEDLQLAAVEALSLFPNRATTQCLIAFLESRKVAASSVRRAVVSYLLKHDQKQLLTRALWALNNRDPRIVANALEVFAQKLPVPIVHLVVRCLNHSNNRVRANAVVALARNGFEAEKCESTLASMRGAQANGSPDKTASAALSAAKSFMFVAGALRRTDLKMEVKQRMFESPDTSLVGNIALIQMGDFEALHSTAGLLVQQIESRESASMKVMLHHISRLPSSDRESVLLTALPLLQGPSSADKVQELVVALLQSPLDFKLELEALNQAHAQFVRADPAVHLPHSGVRSVVPEL